MRIYIHKLEKAGLLDEGIRAGVVSWTVRRWCEIYDHWNRIRQEHGNYQAAILTADTYRVSTTTVYNIIKIMS